MRTPYEMGRAVFDDLSATPVNMKGIQNELAAWQGRNFGAPAIELIALGVSEEVGELCHAILKHIQKIRGYDDPDKFRAEAGDALADIAIYSMQLASALRLDYGTIVEATAKKVLQRDWKKNPVSAAEAG